VEKDSHSGVMESWFSIILVVSVKEVLLECNRRVGVTGEKSVTLPSGSWEFSGQLL
jgi:hypothetical protein